MKNLKVKVYKKLLVNSLFIIFSAVLLLSTVHGNYGNPTAESINEPYWTTNGPFELSPERGRFALTYSLVEDKSVNFSLPVARFVTPDLGYKDGRYVSLFAHGVSFISIPGYLIGRAFGASQVGAFLTSSAFAILNLILIRAVAKKLGVSDVPAVIAGLVFLFATPAFSYATTFYQHHISTFLILFSIYSLLKFDDFKALIFVFFLYAFGISIDYPNAFLMLPILVFSLGKLITKKIDKKNTLITLHTGRLLSLLAILPPLFFFFWFNRLSYGLPFQLAGTVESVDKIDESGYPLFKWLSKEIEPEEGLHLGKGDSALGFFDTRNLRSGLYTHILSPDRGVIYYAPIVLFAIFGYREIKKNGNKLPQLLVSIMGVNLILYSMWGDPWGGWAFGSRYLIPGYALASILLAGCLPKLSKRPLYIFIFFIIIFYSVSVNTVGAVTSISNPPKIEASALEAVSGKLEKYTFERNFDYLLEGKSKSFIYGLVFKKYMSPLSYYLVVSTSIVLVFTTLLAYLTLSNQK